MHRRTPRLLAAAVAAVVATAAVSAPGARALAQSWTLDARAPTDGLRLPPTSAATADEATAPEVNPAGLAQIRKFNFLYAHERDLRAELVGALRPSGGLVGDGLYSGVNLFGGLSFGLSLQWLRFGGLPNYRKTGWTLALGGPALALGASYNLFTAPGDPARNALRSWDLGLQLRPMRWMSLAAVVKDLQKPSYLVELPRRYDFALGLRPFTDRVTLGADWLFDGQNGGRKGLVSVVASVEPISGLLVQGGLGRRLDGNRDLVGQIGLTVNGGYVGASYVAGGATASQGVDHLLQLRLSSERYRSLSGGPARYATLDLADRLSPPRTGLAALIGSNRDPFLDVMGDLARLREDPTVAGVLVKIDALPVGLARAEELRQGLLALRASNKKVVALVQNAGDTEYLVASAAERVVALPQAAFLVNGLSTTTLFFAEGLGKIGVGVDVARVGAYKNAPDAFTRTSMSPEEREQLGAYLDAAFDRYLTSLSEGRRLPKEKLRSVINAGILSARAAQEAGLIDAIAYPDELDKYLEVLEGASVTLLDDVPAPVAVPRRWGGRPDIAVIRIEGVITEGEGGGDGLMGGVAGADAIVHALDAARDNLEVAAVVVRVDSPGGSAAASDLIWRAITKLREKKPVVVSMGDVAASGGYYVAVAGDEILAEPATLTGSIGIFAAKPSFEGLLSKLGIAAETLKRGDEADIFSLTRRWTPAELQQVQRFIEEFYGQFVAKVAEGRHLDRDKVDGLGRGRIWSGLQAQKLGLVDSIGGLTDAIAHARARAGLAELESDVVLVRTDKSATDLPFPASQPPNPALVRAVRAVLGPYGLAAMQLRDEPLAMLPYSVEVR